jgi:hypothetical protein
MPAITKAVEGFLFSLGVLLIMLIALYGLSSLIIKFAPQPVSGWFSTLVQKSAPSGWAVGASNS